MERVMYGIASFLILVLLVAVSYVVAEASSIYQ